ncbi:hypothetical protein D3C87_1297570 [compost metagenome]
MESNRPPAPSHRPSCSPKKGDSPLDVFGLLEQPQLLVDSPARMASGDADKEFTAEKWI